MDWTPVIAAIAAFIALQGPAVANLLVALANRKKLQEVHQNTNGSLAALQAEVARLGAANEALQEKLDKLLSPPGPV